MNAIEIVCRAVDAKLKARGMRRANCWEPGWYVDVLVNVGRGAGQTVFHLHWHVLGGRVDAERVATALAEGA